VSRTTTSTLAELLSFRGIDDPQFAFDLGAAYPEPCGGLVGKGVPLVVDDGRQLGNIRKRYWRLHQQSAHGHRVL
jgi:hypothetical protein